MQSRCTTDDLWCRSSSPNGGRRIGVATGVLAAMLAVSNCGTRAPDPGSEAAATRDGRPNILFIFADDHAYQALSAYGSGLNQTPNLDRIAAQGLRFDRALVTNSICAPSRAVVLTGKYSHLNGVLDNELAFDGSQQTFPKLLQGAGYETAAFGKWHLKSEPTGFDRWEVLPGQGNYYNPDLRTPGGTIRRHGYVTDVVTDLAIDWMQQERNTERPFFMWLGHKAPHRNWMPGPDQLDLYADETMPEPPTLFDDYAGRASPAANQEMEIDRHMTLLTDLKVAPADDNTPEWEVPYWARLLDRFTPAQREAWESAYGPRNEAFRAAGLQGRELVRWKYQAYVKDYLRTIAAVDNSVGRVLDFLDSSGLSDNTIVVYSSDQGFYLGEHGWFDKRWIYEESLRTPLLVRWPGAIDAGATNDSLVSNLDFAPTFLEAASVEIPSDMQGDSLLPLLRGEQPVGWRQSFYYHYYESLVTHRVPEHYGVVTERYKLVRYPITDEWELFDRQQDPTELDSRYGDPAYSEIQAQLASELERLRDDLQAEVDR